MEIGESSIPGIDDAPSPLENAADASLPGVQGARSCTNKRLRKTKLCIFHQQGTCQFAKGCNFAHSLKELNNAPDFRKTQVCKAFAAGCCKDPRCDFAHGEAELRTSNIFFKKNLCIWNERGKCRNGEQCHFAHGLQELRSQQEGKQRHINEVGVGLSTEPTLQNRRLRCNKGKQDKHPTESSAGGHGSSSDVVQKDSPSKPSSGGIRDKVGQQQLDAQPMKVQVAKVFDDALVPPGLTEAKVLRQLQLLGELQRERQAALWQQKVTTLSYHDLHADIESLSRGISWLAAEWNRIQQRLEEAEALKIPPCLTNTLQHNQLSRPHNPNLQEFQRIMLQLQTQTRAMKKSGQSSIS